MKKIHGLVDFFSPLWQASEGYKIPQRVIAEIARLTKVVS
jgi:hypothetical protein